MRVSIYVKSDWKPHHVRVSVAPSSPGSSESTESLKSQSTNCSSQPLLCPTSSLHMEDEHLNPWLWSSLFLTIHQNRFMLYKDHLVSLFLLPPPQPSLLLPWSDPTTALKGSPPGRGRTLFIPSMSLTLEKKFDSCKDALATLLCDWCLKKNKKKQYCSPTFENISLTVRWCSVVCLDQSCGLVMWIPEIFHYLSWWCF